MYQVTCTGTVVLLPGCPHACLFFSLHSLEYSYLPHLLQFNTSTTRGNSKLCALLLEAQCTQFVYIISCLFLPPQVLAVSVSGSIYTLSSFGGKEKCCVSILGCKNTNIHSHPRPASKAMLAHKEGVEIRATCLSITCSMTNVASSPGPTQKSEKGAGVTCKDSRMSRVSSLRLE